MLGVSRINHITLVHTKLEMLISTKYHLNIYGHSTTGFSAWSTQKKDIPSLEYSESIIYNICMYFSNPIWYTPSSFGNNIMVAVIFSPPKIMAGHASYLILTLKCPCIIFM